MYQDENLICKECGCDFVFTSGEQEFYAEKGFQNKPTRCKDCRTARKGAKRELHSAVCAQCGCEAKVPFIPRDDKPVYCSACFESVKSNG